MARPKPVKVGLIGSGAISGTYLNNMVNTFSILDVVGCSDVIPERSAKRAAEYGVKDLTNDQILSDPEIEIVVNTTFPKAHYEVSKRILLSGKHCHSEKMMAVTLAEADELLDIAKKNNLRFGMAPDTFLGSSWQTARKLIDSGFIGEPLYAVAMVVRGYHAAGEGNDVSMVMDAGGGIPFDMGGYYLHALIHLLGPIRAVTGFAKTRGEDRMYVNPRNPHYGETFKFNTINMLSGTLEFHSGVYGSLTAMSDGFGEQPRVEIYGTDGILICGNPNEYGNPVYFKNKRGEMQSIPHTHGYGDPCKRGIGVADMAWAIRNGRPHRCDGIGYHAFEAIHGIWEATKTGKTHIMQSKPAQPAPLPSGFLDGAVQERALDIY